MEGPKTLSEEISDVVRASVRDIIPEVMEQVRRAASEELQPKNQEGEFLLLVSCAGLVVGVFYRKYRTQYVVCYCW